MSNVNLWESFCPVISYDIKQIASGNDNKQVITVTIQHSHAVTHK